MYLRYAWPYLPTGETLAKHLDKQSWYPIQIEEMEAK